ncbi:MAG: chromosome segregation protein SMC [Planctomycetota bacterium]
MHLKRLEAFGFKSFADKVVFDFEPGVTCFVGPNGCGKSNIVDAVKWVLGEQSAKSLRGGEMLDVIFNGTTHRKALNFAEVTLLFDNTSGQLPLNAPEVSVTRRLFRSGESEYLINKAICRLRDVRELFWDTGIGTATYSIIEQGRVAALLEANSKDRRILFEEAAGIHKYKERKHIALRKLERVEQNLARLNDLLNEVDRNLKTVTRQAEKARKAKEITDKLRIIKLDLLLHEAFTSDTSLREVTASLQLVTERVNLLGQELAKAQTVTAEQQYEMGQLDIRLNEAQTALSEARGKLHRLEAEIEAGKRGIEELTAESQRAQEASQAAGDRAAAIALERERVELDAARAEENLKQRAAQSAELTQKIAQEQEARESLLKALETARRAMLDALGRSAQLRDTLTRAEADLSGLEYRARRSQAQATKAEDQLRFAQKESEDVRTRIQQVQQRCEVVENNQRGYRTVQQRTEEDLARIARSTQELQRDLESKRSRLMALESLRESGEGLSPGARAVLTTLRHELNVAHEVHGLVADCLSVEPRLEHAIEAALGSHIETIVLDSACAAQMLAARLSDQELGRATFFPLDRVEAALFSRPLRSACGATAGEGFLGVAADLISCNEQYRTLVQALLGHVLVFETAQQAADAFRADNGSGGWMRISLSGEVFESNGSFSGGRYKPQRQGLIGRKNEIARLNVQLDELQLQLQALAERTAFLEKRAQQLARDDERLSVDLAALALSHTELKSNLAAIEREESRSAEEKNLAVQEIHELEAERQAHLERVIAMRAELEISRHVERDTTVIVQTHETELAQRETALNATREQLAELERDAATWRERMKALERELQSLSSQFAERRDEADREQKRAQNLQQRREITLASLTEKNKSYTEYADLSGVLAMQTATLQEQKENARQAFETARGREREITTELEQARKELSSVHEREVTLRVRLEGKLEQVKSEFQIDALAELSTRGVAPEVALDAVETVRQLEDRLNCLGPVNMYALDEQEELEKRHSFLTVQFEDLQSARASLRDVIARINRRSRSLFQETFDAVKSHFNEMFRKLFGGGKADLMLEEGEDILEAGIEIIARPPGKEPRHISLLSGGEKTMTMIALLFAVFRSRPAPFCILDEVDAPLDESNVDRFNLIVREFLDRSQFVIITHNKKTMSCADILYGITMPEPGVSKRIAVKFEEIEKQLPMEEINQQAEEAREKSLAQAEVAGAPEELNQSASSEDSAIAAATIENELELQTVAGGV